MTHRLLRGAGCIVLAAAVGAAAGPPEDSRREAERLRGETEILRKHVELASGGAFYLVLDPQARTLTLMLKGSVLRRYDISNVEIGEPRIAFLSSEHSPTEWQGKIWSGGNLVPSRDRDRLEIQVPPPGVEVTEPVVPPLPEEAYLVPPRYGIRFQGGLFLEVLPRGGDSERGLWGRFGAWWEDLIEVLRPKPTDRLRLRIALRASDAQALYRSLPPDTKLLILPPK